MKRNDQQNGQDTPAVNKGGAPAGNKNAMRHGLTVGTLPKSCSYVTKATNQFRRELEVLVLEEHGGEIDLYRASLIHSACRWERHALLCQRWLRQCGDVPTITKTKTSTKSGDTTDSVEKMTPEGMTHEQRLSYSREICKASEGRDRCIEKLGLVRSPRDDALLIPVFDSPPAPTQSEAVAVAPTVSVVSVDPSPAVSMSPQIPDPVEGSVE